MKKQILFLAAAIVAAASVAQTSHTVSNNPANPAQFTEIQEAINAASDGDTIYVAGSATAYGNLRVDKRLVIIGDGHTPNGGANDNTTVGRIDITSDADDAGGSGSVIVGFLITGDVQGDNDSNISDVVLERNRFNNVNFNIAIETGTASGWIIRNNIFYLNESDDFQCNDGTQRFILLEESEDILFTNNIISTTTSDPSNYYCSAIGSFSVSNVFINNVFFKVRFRINNSSNISNNILIDCLASESTNNTLANNLHEGSFFSGATNTLIGNLSDDALFVAEANDLWGYDDDLNLQSASIGKNAGTDGTDVGIYGGNFPMVFEPSNPEITQLLINTVQVPVGGELEFTIQAEGRQ